MPRKLTKWWMRTPGACVSCPWCGKQSYVMIQMEVKTDSTKAYKVIKKEVKGSGTDGAGTDQADGQ